MVFEFTIPLGFLMRTQKRFVVLIRGVRYVAEFAPLMGNEVFPEVPLNH